MIISLFLYHVATRVYPFKLFKLHTILRQEQFFQQGQLMHGTIC